MKWTMDQRAAIEARGSNLLLSAAAGSGKTTVLVERVAELLKEGADIREMLIVTFTRAAAADMRMSLIRRLNALALGEDGQGGDPRYRQQAEYAEFASISTIHSFCTDLLRAFFQVAAVDPAFRIADGPEAAILSGKALQNAMNEVYGACAQGNAPAHLAADHEALTRLRSPEEVQALTMQLYHFLMERPDPWGWLGECIAALERGEDGFSRVLCEAACSRLQDARAMGEYALNRCRRMEALAPYEATAADDLKYLDELLALAAGERAYERMQEALSAASFKRLPTVRGVKDDPDCNAYKELRDVIKKTVKKAGERLPLMLPGALNDLPECAAELRGLRTIVRKLDEEYTRLKDERSLLTFTDLERRTLQALQEPEVAQAMHEKYAFVFVDEYQDVSDMQEAILSRVARENALFCVGDVKQSIYRFRHAEPTLFMRKYEDYRQESGAGRLIVLNQNFRSRANILEYTNEVFRRVMRGGDSEIVYDEAAQLYPGARCEGEDAPVELHLIDKADPEETESAAEDGEHEAQADEAAALISEMKDAEAEALLIARRMAQLHGTPVWDGKKGEWRALTWRDFVILTRQAREVAQQMLAVLRREGIPAYADVSGGYLDVMEVQVALALLRLVENRRRDAEWIAVLRAPGMNLSSAELAQIRARHPEGSYYEAVLDYAQAGDEQEGPEDGAACRRPSLVARLKGLLRRLDHWRALGRALPLSQQVHLILTESGFYRAAGALPGGTQRQANLDILLERAAGYEQAHAGGLTGFIGYIEEMHSANEDMGEAHVLGENDDVVRIMTVHKSKGLEFPVVFGALLGRKLGGGARKGEFFAHRQTGIGLKHMDLALGSCRDTLPRLAAQALNERESQAEELRILYVLLTRARDRLILTGSVGNAEQAMMRWQVSRAQPLRANCFLDVLAPPMADMPGGEVLSDWINAPAEGMPRVQVEIVSRAELAQGEEQAGEDHVARMDEARRAEADERLLDAYRWVYPHEQAVLLPLKLTASGISRELTGPAQPPELIPRPQFLAEETGMTGAERGTATHAALQGLELTPLRSLAGDALHSAVVMQLNALTEQGALTPAMREAVSPRTIARFLEGETGTRMRHAQTLHREWMFTLKMSTEEALGIPSQEDVLVQGAVDCCFLENGEWVLLDYKTDRAQDEDALVERYRPQLSLYGKALQRITGKRVKEILLCLLGAGREIEIQPEG